MAEASPQKQPIDLLQLERLVPAHKITDLHERRNCLVHAMDPYDIIRVVWELVKQLPMMNMHRMYNTKELLRIGYMHLQAVGEEDVLTPLDNGKQTTILCPVYLPLKRAPYPNKKFPFDPQEPMEPMRCSEQASSKGALEQIILIDRDAGFHVYEAYWSTRDEFITEPPHLYGGFPQLKELCLTEIKSASGLYHNVLGARQDAVTFFWHATKFLQMILSATLDAVRREYEKSIGAQGAGDELAHEKYLTIVRADNLLRQVKSQMHRRYGV